MIKSDRLKIINIMQNLRKQLKEAQKNYILQNYKDIGPHWTIMSKKTRVKSKHCKIFYAKLQKTRNDNPKMGRPKELTDEIKDGVIGAIEFDPETSLREIQRQLQERSSTTIKSNSDPKLPYPL